MGACPGVMLPSSVCGVGHQEGYPLFQTLQTLQRNKAMRIRMSAAAAVLLMACAEATSPGRPPAQLRVAGTVNVAAPEAVLPSGYTSIMGGTNNNFPHASFVNMRYQQVFLGSDVINPVIVGLCLRRDEVIGAVSREKTLTIRLGPTSLDYTNLGSSFADNYSAPPTEVFSGNVILPASVGDGTPADFDFCVPFTNTYEHPAGSNIIVEVINTSINLSDVPRDACAAPEPACTTARAYALNPAAATATVIQQRGVIMKFISPEPPRPLDPVSKEECLKGGWSNFDFKNQGQCIRFVETSFDSRLPEPEQ